MNAFSAASLSEGGGATGYILAVTIGVTWLHIPLEMGMLNPSLRSYLIKSLTSFSASS